MLDVAINPSRPVEGEGPMVTLHVFVTSAVFSTSTSVSAGDANNRESDDDAFLCHPTRNDDLFPDVAKALADNVKHEIVEAVMRNLILTPLLISVLEAAWYVVGLACCEMRDKHAALIDAM